MFSTYVHNFTLVCREYPLRDAPRSDCVLYGFRRRRTDLSRAEFNASWLDGLTSWLAGDALRQAGRVVHNSVVQAPPPGNAFDGVGEWWFTSPAAMRAAFAADGVRASLPAVLADLVDLPGSVFMATRVAHSRP